jgi:tetratricopeptide (TPR) repeat protein
MGLLLAAVDVTGPLRWRWLLRDEESQNPLADHQVRLDPASDEVARFGDLYGYTRSYATMDRRTQDETRFVTEAGAWAGRELLGESVGAAILAEAPVTVRVTVPPALDPVLLWPLELAHAGGKPLAAQGDVTLVYDIAPDITARRKSEVGAALRMLAVFSQPTKTSVLALRRERYALAQLIRRISAHERAMVHLQVVQYGVTRRRLEQIADSSDGWDVLHLSGHGAGGVFALEKDDGSADLVSTGDLVELLRPVRRRVKLAVVSACESAADTTAQTLRLLGLTEQAQAVEAESTGQAATQVPGLARQLVRELDCAVVAMRYPVTDEFAIGFGDVFYERLFGRGQQPVDVAAARALKEASGPAPSAARSAISLATPGVFGARAPGLTLTVPRGRPVMDPAEQRMAYFPAEPARFVGRAEAMAKASAALAPGSGRTALLLHGMAGAGKTACALELAYRHAEVFAAAAFWQAPTREEEWASALPDFAKRLDIQLGDYGFTMASHIGTVAALENFLPRLRQVMAASGVLLVLDNLETLLTADGLWRDPRWGQLIAALTDHDGESRVILTSRTAPAGTPNSQSRVVTLPVHALSLEESAALARELPHLRELLHADPGPVRSPAVAQADRERVLRVLRVVQGHPKLMELADAAAADTERLDAQLVAAEQASAGRGSLEAFFHNGTSTLEPDQFLDALAGWTTTALEVLSPQARLMAEFVACLEDGDRVSSVIEANWADLWQRLDQPNDPPEPGPLLTALTAAALLEAEAASVQDAGDQPSGGDQREAESQPRPVIYRVHPGVAAAIIAAEPEIEETTDAALADFWYLVAYQAMMQEGGEDSGLVVRAGLAATPYLLRCGGWDVAGVLLEEAITRDESPGTVQEALSALRRIATAAGTPETSAMLARALMRVDPGEAERLLRVSLDAATDAGHHRLASATAGHLVILLRRAGRLREALEVAEQQVDYTQQAGLGPWTQLSDQGQRLQVLAQMGEHARVLTEVERLRAVMAELPALHDASEAVAPWNVREAMLGLGRSSALATGDWELCLDLNAEAVASKRERGAGVHEITRNRFNDAGPLIRLGRLEEAGRLLADCQRVFEDHADTGSLATVLSTRADLEYQLGRCQAAIDLERAAIRLSYALPDPQDIAISHHNLANYLRHLGSDAAGQRAHRLAAALVARLAGMAHYLDGTMRVLARELRLDDGGEALPSTVADVIAVAGRTEGVRLGEMLAALQPDPQVVEDALTEILHTAAALQDDNEPDVQLYLQHWEPAIAAIVAACQPGQEASVELIQFLDETAEQPDWAALIAVLRRVVARERGESLLNGLNAVHMAIIRETLARLGQEP